MSFDKVYIQFMNLMSNIDTHRSMKKLRDGPFHIISLHIYYLTLKVFNFPQITALSM